MPYLYQENTSGQALERAEGKRIKASLLHRLNVNNVRELKLPCYTD